MNINAKVKLNNDVEMPVLGLGTWQTGSKDAENAVLWALQAGYRHIDTAAVYGNEAAVGNAIRKSSVQRKELFITTKLWNDDHDDPAKACSQSLKKLQLDYIDLYLMHWPVERMRNKTWKIMEDLYRQGKCRAIGVSNFTIKHLNELLMQAKIVPAVNQVEFNSYLYQKELLDFCRSQGIQLEAYSPLTRGKKLGDPKLVSIAKKYSKTSAQILIRWALQHGIIAIPKSKSQERIQENADVFDFSISREDMEILDVFNENLRLCWDPTDVL